MTVESVIAKYKNIINTKTPEYWYPFSLISLNQIVGDVRGLRGGRMYQFLGKESTGKTTLSLDIIANAQKQGLACCYVDFERTFEDEYAEKLGVNLDELLVVRADTAEDALTVVEELLKSGIMVVVIDSIPAAVPKIEADKDYNENEKMASNAALVNRMCRRLVPLLSNSGAICIAINQYRANISTMSRKETKPFGAMILQYTVSLTLELARIKNEEDETQVQVTVGKSKIGIERKRAIVTMVYGSGLNYEEDVLTLALEHDIIQRKGAWFTYNDFRAQGMENAIKTFPIEEIKEKVLYAME